MTAKILVLDIETKPATAYVWRLFDETVGLEQLIAPSQIIAVGAKWYGRPTMYYKDVWKKGRGKDGSRGGMLCMAHDLMSQADAIVTFNGDKFDIPKLVGEFAEVGLPPLPPIASIDVRKTTSKMGYTSGKLAHVAPLLGCGSKRENSGFRLWREYLEGDPAARKEMRLYNLQDVRVLEDVYTKVRPFIKTHPYLAGDRGLCPHCGSSKVHRKGVRRTKSFWIDRLHCQNCGAWSDGSRRKIA